MIPRFRTWAPVLMSWRSSWVFRRSAAFFRWASSRSRAFSSFLRWASASFSAFF